VIASGYGAALPHIKAEHPTRDSIEGRQSNSLTKSTLTFALHQFIGMCGIPFAAPVIFSLGFKVLLFYGHRYPQRTFSSILTETPYFPVQVIFALILGWLLGRALRHQSIVWVWVLPCAILCYLVATATVLNPGWISVLARPGLGESRFSYYFGWGCQPAAHCLDQLLVTMPFYSSLAYSLGAVLGRGTLGYAFPENKNHFRAVTLAGIVVLAALAIDLIISIQQSGWHRNYALLALAPTGLGAFLLYAGCAIRRQSVSSASENFPYR
jgi:hypothetical protein